MLSEGRYSMRVGLEAALNNGGLFHANTRLNVLQTYCIVCLTNSNFMATNFYVITYHLVKSGSVTGLKPSCYIFLCYSPKKKIRSSESHGMNPFCQVTAPRLLL